MGDRCSCLYNNQDEHVDLYQNHNTNSQYNYNENTPSKISNVKLKNSFHSINNKRIVSSNSLPEKPQNKDFNGEELKYYLKQDSLNQIIKLQSYFRSFITKRKFKHNRSRLEDFEKQMKSQMRISYHSANLYRADAFMSHDYYKTGWTKFYKTDDPSVSKYFKRDYGKVFHRKLFKKTIKVDNIQKEIIYTGQMNIYDQRHGHGELLVKNAEKYIGFWNEDVFEGWGRMINSEGDVYEGNKFTLSRAFH